MVFQMLNACTPKGEELTRTLRSGVPCIKETGYYVFEYNGYLIGTNGAEIHYEDVRGITRMKKKPLLGSISMLREGGLPTYTAVCNWRNFVCFTDIHHQLYFMDLTKMIHATSNVKVDVLDCWDMTKEIIGHGLGDFIVDVRPFYDTLAIFLSTPYAMDGRWKIILATHNGTMASFAKPREAVLLHEPRFHTKTANSLSNSIRTIEWNGWLCFATWQYIVCLDGNLKTAEILHDQRATDLKVYGEYLITAGSSERKNVVKLWNKDGSLLKSLNFSLPVMCISERFAIIGDAEKQYYCRAFIKEKIQGDYEVTQQMSDLSQAKESERDKKAIVFIDGHIALVGRDLEYTLSTCHYARACTSNLSKLRNEDKKRIQNLYMACLFAENPVLPIEVADIIVGFMYHDGKRTRNHESIQTGRWESKYFEQETRERKRLKL